MQMHHQLQKHKKGPDFYPILSSERPTENHPHFRPAIPDTLDCQQLKKSTNNHKQQPSDQTDDERKQDGKCELKAQNSEHFHENNISLAARHYPAPPFAKTTIKIFQEYNNKHAGITETKEKRDDFCKISSPHRLQASPNAQQDTPSIPPAQTKVYLSNILHNAPKLPLL